jgi:hypothetical protein
MPTTTPTADGGLLDITLPQPLWRDALDAFSGMRGGRDTAPGPAPTQAPAPAAPGGYPPPADFDDDIPF